MLASTYIHPPCHLVLLSFFLPSLFLLSTCYNPFPLRVSIPVHCTSQSISLSIPFSACLNPFLYLSQSLSLPVSMSFSACFKSLSPVYLNPFLCLFQSLSLPVSIPFFACLNPFLCLSQSLTLLVSIPFYACLNPFLGPSLINTDVHKKFIWLGVDFHCSANGRILFRRGEPAPFHWRSHSK